LRRGFAFAVALAATFRFQQTKKGDFMDKKIPRRMPEDCEQNKAAK
jgi:hypothetical protein